MTPTMNDIVSIVATRFQISISDIRGRSKLRLHAWPRQIVMLLASEMTSNAGANIGRYLNRDHSTQIYGVRNARARMLTNPDFAAQVASCRALVACMPGWKAEAARSVREYGLARYSNELSGST